MGFFKKALSALGKNEVNIIQIYQKDQSDGQPIPYTPGIFYEAVAYAGLLFSMVVILILSGVLMMNPTCPDGDSLSDGLRNGSPTRTGIKRAGIGSVEEGAVAGSWGRYQISRTAVTSIPYHGIRILIYRRLVDAADGEYYFAPALIINETSVITVPNVFDRRLETRFAVIMYSREIIAHLRRNLEILLSQRVKELRVIPVEEIRILPSSDMDTNFEVDSMWKSYAKQPSDLEFRVLCTSITICENVAHNIRNHPKHFAANLEVQYTMESQKTAARRLRVTVENIQNSHMYTELNQRYKDKDYAYIGASDAKKIQLEVMSNVMASEVTDAEFLTRENMPTIVNLIDAALNFQAVEAAAFSQGMWNSTFWSEENARPDRVARELQDEYNKMSKTEQSAFQQSHAQSQTKEECGSGGLQIPGIGGASVKHCEGSSSSSSNSNGGSSDNYQDRMKKNKVVVVGDKIIPKSTDLKRANLAELRQKTNIESTQIRVAKVHGVLKSNLNVVLNSRNQEVFYVRTKNPSSGFIRTDAMAICQDYYDASLATINQLRLAWASGANWCFIGHVKETIAYPSHTCTAQVELDINGAPACNSAADIEKHGVVIPKPRTNTTLTKTGFNCFGVKPQPLYHPGRDQDILLTAWFNSTHYSQHL